MKPALVNRISSVVLISLNILGITCCSPTQLLEPTMTVTSTRIPTKTFTSVPTVTSTPEPSNTPAPTMTKLPSPTATTAPVPTSSIDDPEAIPILDICRTTVDGLYELKKDLGLPDHYLEEDSKKAESDFDPNQYFDVLAHLNIQTGTQLDYVYFSDWLGGKPLLYARKISDEPYQTYEEFLASYGEEVSGETSYSGLNHSFDFLDAIKVDKSAESYFQFVSIALLGDQFYLWWHGLYDDVKIICDTSDIESVREDMKLFDIDLPEDLVSRVPELDVSPVVVMDEKLVKIRFITFTKWGGFYENIYIMDTENPYILLDSEFNPLIEYDCGISF
jgi:hypothetical protein